MIVYDCWDGSNSKPCNFRFNSWSKYDEDESIWKAILSRIFAIDA